MSEKSKGDTSRIVKNPLLSASVTGLTFDDFSCTPVLLPAAPQIERRPPSPRDINILTKETPVVQNFDSDSDAFSEINLNATADEDNAQPGPTNFVNPLEDSQNTSEASILSQAASSFSQLPSVASTVFSTFSKVIKDYTPTTTQSNTDSYFVKPEEAAPVYAPFYAPHQLVASDISTGIIDQIPPEPPKFYSPAEVPSNPFGTGIPSANNQNTYRLSAKKKTYAQIPGLSTNFQHSGNSLNEQPQPIQQNLPVRQSFTAAGPVFDLQATSTEIYQFTEPLPPTVNKDDRRSLFLLSNVVAPVWQNLSGLVGKSTSQEEQLASSPFIPQQQIGHNSELFSNQATNPSSFSQPSSAQYFSTPTPVQPSNFPEVISSFQPAEPLELVAPVIQPLPNIIPTQQLVPSDHTQAGHYPPLQQPPPQGGNNNFRLQKGTRHYRSALKPSINSNSSVKVIQPPVGQASQTISASEPFFAFNPITSIATNQLDHPTPVVPLINPTVPVSLPQPVQFTTRGQTLVHKEETKPDAISFPDQRQVLNLEQFQTVPLFAPVPQSYVKTTIQESQIASVPLLNPVCTPPILQTFPLSSFHKEELVKRDEDYQGQAEQPQSIPLFVAPTSSYSTYRTKDQSNPLQNSVTTASIQLTPCEIKTDTKEETEPDGTNAQDQDRSGQLEQFQSVPLFVTVPQVFPEKDILKSSPAVSKSCVNIKLERLPAPSAPEYDILQSSPAVLQSPVNNKLERLPGPTTPEFKEFDLTKSSQLNPVPLLSSPPSPQVFAPVPTLPFQNPTTPASIPPFSSISAPITDLFSLKTSQQNFTPIPAALDLSLLQENIIAPSEPVFTENPIDQKPQNLTLTNYFAVQSNADTGSLFIQSQPDFNANRNIEELSLNNPQPPQIHRKQTEITNFFTLLSQNEDNRNNNANVIPALVANLPNPLEFFDSFHQSSATTIPTLNQINSDNNNYDTKTEAENNFQIQNFFNNPPQNLNQSASELNYNLVGSNFINKNSVGKLSASRAISPQSNVVEPPSSSCSEFSTEAFSQNSLNLSKLTNDDIPEDLKSEYLDQDIMASLINSKDNLNTNVVYRPAEKHWFYKKKVDDKNIWTPFSYHDSALIEEHFANEDLSKIVAVEGGRYDVNIEERTRLPIFWSGVASEVRRCSWFYKAVDSRYVPYEESTADKLEIEYEEASVTGEWHRKIALPTGETVVFHGATVLVHFLQTQPSDSWGTTQTTNRPRIVKRDLDDFNIESGESNKVDHLLFMVHGIGSVCDLKFRTVEEVVDEFRNIGTQLIQSHYKNACDGGCVGRVEVLPVSWHSELHSEESGIDEKLKAITLESIPKLRNFANDTLLDVLFYTSPVFCQNIMDTVAETMNKVYLKYCQRNPRFTGGVSLAGHSLGSLILFDLLCHQKIIENADMQNSENPDQPITPLQFRAQTPTEATVTTSKQVSYTVGPAGTGQAFINYPQLAFQPKKFFALGSPIGMFVTIRGIDGLGLNFKLPTCSGFYNIFHPYDPVAYRIEALVNADLSKVRPVLISHHKGRKRMHLELKETMIRVGADIKQKIVETFNTTLDTVYHLTSKQKTDTNSHEIEREVDKVLEMQLKIDKETRSRANSTSTQSDIDTGETDVPLGMLNEARRIDYVLQEAPVEFFNEYLFALTSHVCYWESEDTILFIMKEIYSSLGIRTDSQVPQQTMTIERPNSNSFSLNELPGPSTNPNIN